MLSYTIYINKVYLKYVLKMRPYPCHGKKKPSRYIVYEVIESQMIVLIILLFE